MECVWCVNRMLDIGGFETAWRNLDVFETLEREMQNRRRLKGLQWACVDLVSEAASCTGSVALDGISR